MSFTKSHSFLNLELTVKLLCSVSVFLSCNTEAYTQQTLATQSGIKLSRLSAQNGFFDYARRFLELRDYVQADMGDNRLTCDRMQVQFTKNDSKEAALRSAQSLQCSGHVRFWNAQYSITSQDLMYQVNEQRIVFRKDVKVSSCQGVLMGSKIEYNLKTEVLDVHNARSVGSLAKHPDTYAKKKAMFSPSSSYEGLTSSQKKCRP